jgi:hypothetical protein
MFAFVSGIGIGLGTHIWSRAWRTRVSAFKAATLTGSRPQWVQRVSPNRVGYGVAPRREPGARPWGGGGGDGAVLEDGRWWPPLDFVTCASQVLVETPKCYSKCPLCLSPGSTDGQGSGHGLRGVCRDVLNTLKAGDVIDSLLCVGGEH